jgi:hypothetical protein
VSSSAEMIIVVYDVEEKLATFTTANRKGWAAPATRRSRLGWRTLSVCVAVVIRLFTLTPRKHTDLGFLSIRGMTLKV